MLILDEHHDPAAVAPKLQPLVRWLAWPSGLAAAAAASWMLTRDAALAMPLQMATMLAALMIVVLAERIVPFRREWQRAPRSERRTDFTSMAVLMALADPLVKLVLLPLIASATVALAGVGEGLGWFPRGWPIAAQLGLAAVIAEFGQYWMHRGAHALRWMWGVHGFHHNPTRIYWLNAFRVNPLNMIWHHLAGLGVLVAIGTPAVVVQMLILFGTVVAIFQHANADLRYGGWNRVFGTADLHRWHHATGADAAQVNFGTVLMLWDQVFGTYRNGSSAPRAVGVDAGPPRATGYLSGLAEALRNARAGRAPDVPSRAADVEAAGQGVPGT
jgi:sterol desaturase/sphingolipid hydroxylase (fatty acid hydroxylase superfamily)